VGRFMVRGGWQIGNVPTTSADEFFGIKAMEFMGQPPLQRRHGGAIVP
jgi:hypothetical protein